MVLSASTEIAIIKKKMETAGQTTIEIQKNGVEKSNHQVVCFATQYRDVFRIYRALFKICRSL